MPFKGPSIDIELILGRLGWIPVSKTGSECPKGRRWEEDTLSAMARSSCRDLRRDLFEKTPGTRHARAAQREIGRDPSIKHHGSVRSPRLRQELIQPLPCFGGVCSRPGRPKTKASGSSRLHLAFVVSRWLIGACVVRGRLVRMLSIDLWKWTSWHGHPLALESQRQRSVELREKYQDALLDSCNCFGGGRGQATSLGSM